MKGSKKDFIAEAEEIIETASNSLLKLQGAFDPDALNALFRAIHTMKGLSGLFGLKGITQLSHNLESLLDDLRLGRIDLTDETINFIFRNIDILKKLITSAAEDKEVEDVSGAINEIESFREACKSRVQEVSLEGLGISPSILRLLSEYESHRLKSNIKDGRAIYLVKSVFDLATFDRGIESLNQNLKNIGEVIATLPTSEGIPQGSIGFTILLGSLSPIETVREKAKPQGVEMLIPPRVAPKPVPAVDVTLRSATTTVRVDIEKLDRILNTVSELELAKGAVFRIGEELAETFGYTPLTLDVHKIAQSLDRRLAELQEEILELRMVPFSQIFARLSQVVRRHAGEVGKEIDLEIFGEDTEIDKFLAEEIIDPLIHIIRNAIDHGIESKEKRIAMGKKERGTITVKALPKGNNVVITIQDDGAGLDLNSILRKAKENKLIPEEQVLERKEIIDLIFLPGLSTKEDVSEVSGRGMGVNIVKEKITSFGGFVDVETESGSGTTFTISMPITLAIVKALIVQVADEQFVIPLTAISETFIVRTEEIKTIEGREVIGIRDEMLPLLRVGRVFMLEEGQRDEYFGIVVGTGERRIGLLVDNILGQTGVVIKPLGEYLKGIPGLAGAAEIGRHELVLVLDIEALMEGIFSKRKVKVA